MKQSGSLWLDCLSHRVIRAPSSSGYSTDNFFEKLARCNEEQHWYEKHYDNAAIIKHARAYSVIGLGYDTQH